MQSTIIRTFTLSPAGTQHLTRPFILKILPSGPSVISLPLQTRPRTSSFLFLVYLVQVT